MTLLLEQLQINGIQMVEASVQRLDSTLGFPYLELGLDATSRYAGFIAGVFLGPHMSTTADQERVLSTASRW